MESQGIITHTGTIVDATFVDAPRQRNTREENNQIKNGEIPKEWEKNTHKLAQKIQTPVGQRKMMKLITDIKIM